MKFEPLSRFELTFLSQKCYSFLYIKRLSRVLTEGA